MIKNLLILSAILIVTAVSYGQTRISLFAGYGFSQFDDQVFADDMLDQTGYLPVGANVEFGRSMFTFGAEVNYSVLPFSFDLEEEGVGKAGELDITQFVVGGFVKARFGDRRDINPYIRGGIGYYSGKGKVTFNQDFKDNSPGVEDSETDFKAAIGFNGAIGLDFPVSPNTFIFLEAIYHFVEREFDVVDATSFRANNFAFHLGFTYML